MKKFLLKISFFTIPFFLSYFINRINYDAGDGDLIRMSYLYENPSIKNGISNRYIRKKKYNTVSEANIFSRKEIPEYDILNIGDSFSDQGNLSYQNFLSEKKVSVLSVDRYLSGENPVQRLVQLINSGFFEKVHVNYVVLQSAERHFIHRCESTSLSKTISLDSLNSVGAKFRDKSPSKKVQVQFFSSSTVKGPLANILFNFSNSIPFSNTYRVRTTSDELFTNNPKNLLFYRKDIENLSSRNDFSKIFRCNEKLNTIANRLKEKGIALVLLVSPDKFNLYYSYIETPFSKEPKLYATLSELEHNYILFPALELLKKEVDRGVKEVYYYDDTHWSPIGSKIIAEGLADIILNNSW